MRLKEFLIATAIFTVCYILFFVLFDLFINKKIDSDHKKEIKSLISIDNYKRFAAFYGIQSTLPLDRILSIQDTICNAVYPINLSEYTNKLGINQYEFIVCILFFEYLNIVPRRTISIESNTIMNPNLIDSNLINKYTALFNNKMQLDDILKSAGGNAYNDVVHLNQLFLIPGVRLINNQLFYMGDLNEKS